MQPATLHDIPIVDDTLRLTLSYLGPKDLIHAGQVNRRWRSIASEDLLWKPLFLKEFPYNPREKDYKKTFLKLRLIPTNLLHNHYRLGSVEKLPKSKPRLAPKYEVTWDKKTQKFILSDPETKEVHHYLKPPGEELPKSFMVYTDRIITYSRKKGAIILYDMETGRRIQEVSVCLLPQIDNYFLEACSIQGEWLAIPYDRSSRVHLMNLKTGHSQDLALTGEYLKHDEFLTIYTELKGRYINCYASHIFSDPPKKALNPCSECVLV